MVFEEVPTYAHEHVREVFELKLSTLYQPRVVVLPLTPEGELERQRLYDEEFIYMYGCYEYNFTLDGEIFLAILINQD